jgi:hypothetical protein
MMERKNTTEVREEQSNNVSEMVKMRNGVSLRRNGWPVFELGLPGYESTQLSLKQNLDQNPPPPPKKKKLELGTREGRTLKFHFCCRGH